MEVRCRFKGSQEELNIAKDQQKCEENGSPSNMNEEEELNIYDDEEVTPKQEVGQLEDNNPDDIAYDAPQDMSDLNPNNNNSDNKLLQPDNNDSLEHDDQSDSDDSHRVVDGKTVIEFDGHVADHWVLPPESHSCTLEEIRRGQIVNNKAFNECPVLGCGRKINESNSEPSPGTIASGLKTHVLFVHYSTHKMGKKRKTCWSSKRRHQTSPKKPAVVSQRLSSPACGGQRLPSPVRGGQQLSSPACGGQKLSLPPCGGQQLSSPASSVRDYDIELDSQSSSVTSNNQSSGLNLIHKSTPSPYVAPASKETKAKPPVPGSILNKKVKQMAARAQSQQMSSLQSLMQATGGGIDARVSHQPKQNNNFATTNGSQKNFNSTTSSLFSILAGLTQRQQEINQHQNQHQLPQSSISLPESTPNPATNTLKLPQSSKTPIATYSRAANSSLLSLLNEKISGNVATSLQSQLKKSMGSEPRSKLPTTTLLKNPQLDMDDTGFYEFQTDGIGSLNGSSFPSNIYSVNGDNRSPDSSILNSFIESIAMKTGSNISAAGVVEARKILEKFTTSLMCSSQTIADHYLAPFVGEVPQQKPEISPSDVVLAYKMMHKSHGQP